VGACEPVDFVWIFATLRRCAVGVRTTVILRKTVNLFQTVIRGWIRHTRVVPCARTRLVALGVGATAPCARLHFSRMSDEV
jgi:hypothetical protein